MAKQRVIVTGSRGLIGSALVAHLSKTHEVFELDLQLGHDLTQEAFVKDWFSTHPADYLVNCFALNHHISSFPEETLWDVSLESIQTYLTINLVSLFSVCRAFARQENALGIVNFSSTYGVVSPLPTLYDKGEKHIGYSISKGGVVQLTRHLAVHLAPRVRVNCLIPGGVQAAQPEAFQEAYAAHTPLKRMMHNTELNGMIGLLCSEESSYITGAVLTVDGGWTAR